MKYIGSLCFLKKPTVFFFFFIYLKNLPRYLRILELYLLKYYFFLPQPFSKKMYSFHTKNTKLKYSGGKGHFFPISVTLTCTDANWSILKGL